MDVCRSTASKPCAIGLRAAAPPNLYQEKVVTVRSHPKPAAIDARPPDPLHPQPAAPDGPPPKAPPPPEKLRGPPRSKGGLAFFRGAHHGPFASPRCLRPSRPKPQVGSLHRCYHRPPSSLD